MRPTPCMYADFGELVNGRCSAQNGPVADFHVSAQNNGVDNHAVIADMAVVRNVHIRHQEAIGADLRLAGSNRPLVDRDTFPDSRVIADHRESLFSVEFQVLGNSGDTCSRKIRQFLPIRAPSKMVTFDPIQVPSPISTFLWITAKGSITTLGAIFASGWTYASGCIIRSFTAC